MGLDSRDLLTVLLVLLLSLCCIDAVKHENFKTCSQSGFCKRNREYADGASSRHNWQSPYSVESNTLHLREGVLSGTLLKTEVGSDEVYRFPFNISFYQSGVARLTLDEEIRRKGNIVLRHNSTAQKQRYNEAEKWSIVGGTHVNKGTVLKHSADAGRTEILYGPENRFEAWIQHSPFAIDFRRDGETQIQFNRRGFMNIEHWRVKTSKSEQKVDQEQKVIEEINDESTWWEESFGGNTDSKPKGPEAIALDIQFPQYRHVYGAAEHAGPLSLKETRGGVDQYSEPYRLYNSDVFEYELDSPMTLYGAIPFMQAQKSNSSAGVLWLNAAETWIDIAKRNEAAHLISRDGASGTTTSTHWMSESGVMDIFIFLGPKPQDILGAYAELTGYTQLPQQFATAYHQCRWNYVTDEDVRDVDRKFDKHKIPYDVIWLDIEYTEGKKYFTWDKLTFPDPLAMQNQLDEHERKLVAIIDPHIKNENDYFVLEEMKEQSLAVLNKEGSIYEGWCWPGSSHWIDCFSPEAREWWKSLFRYDRFIGAAKNMFIWNDMNEPSVFNGPETTMPKDNIHHGNWEHRDVHNLYGMTLINATYQALLARDKEEQKRPRRPFLLTRSFFVGSQRLAAMWTGDNLAEWSHLQASIPMILSLGISGFPFAGADVGGFFGNPGKELLTRWYQAGAFYPFFRGHAHIDTRRREPYLAGEPYTGVVTQALRLRYSLLPTWYTAFYEASTSGAPIIRPNYYVFPGDESGFGLDDQFYLGDSGLLVKPVVHEGQAEQNIYLADHEIYYDYFSYQIHQGPGTARLAAPLGTIPLLMQGGHIFPRRDRPRRSSGLMRHDPFTLIVVIGHDGNAAGALYMDDGQSFDYKEGAYIHRNFRYNKTTSSLTSSNAAVSRGKRTSQYLQQVERIRVEKIVIVGAPNSWESKTSVEVNTGSGNSRGTLHRVDIKFIASDAGKGHSLLIRDPGITIASDWTIII